MTDTNPDDIRDVCAGLITMASISSSYKVESTKDIIVLWNDLRTNLPINNDLDYLAVILSLGRIVDLQADQINVDELQTIVGSFRSKLDELISNQEQVTFSELGAAYLTMACVSHSQEVESIISVVNHWDEVRKSVPINDHIDLASAVLATGRIMDLRVDTKSPEILTDIVINIRTEMESQNISVVDYKELSILLLAAAIVELSPKVETYRDIVKSWFDLRPILKIDDIYDVVSVILFSGKIRDMDISMFIYPASIPDQISFIRTAIDNV